MTRPTLSRRFAMATTAAIASLCVFILDVAPYAADALDMLKDAEREREERERRAESAGAPPRPSAERDEPERWNISIPAPETHEAAEKPATIELRMQRYDVAALEMSRFHADTKRAPDDGALLQFAFETGLHNHGNFQPKHVSRFLLDGAGPLTNMIATIRVCPKQLAKLEVLRHELTAPGDALVSVDEAVRVSIRRGLEHVRHFGMPKLGHDIGMIAAGPVMPVPYLG